LAKSSPWYPISIILFDWKITELNLKLSTESPANLPWAFAPQPSKSKSALAFTLEAIDFVLLIVEILILSLAIPWDSSMVSLGIMAISLNSPVRMSIPGPI
jgi:hypothetical protein